MNDVEKCYRRAINYNARTIQYALLHIVHQKGSEKTVYYEEDYLNKAGLHTIYYGYNMSADAPELVVRSNSDCIIFGVKDNQYVRLSNPARSLTSRKKYIIDQVNEGIIASYLSLRHEERDGHPCYIVLNEDHDHFVETTYLFEGDFIKQMIVKEARDEELQKIHSLTTFTVSHINKHSFKDYLHILSLTNKYKNQPVIAKTAFLEDLGLEAQSIYKEIQAIAKGTPE